MDPKELGALGGALSAFIAAVSYWAKTKHERRRATRTVLYYLLELHHVVLRLQQVSESLDSAFPAELKIQYASKGVLLNEAELKLAIQSAKPALMAFGRAQMEGTVADIADAFSKGLAEMAKEDPILAFRLRGRDQLMLLPQKISGFLTEHSKGPTEDHSQPPEVCGPFVDEMFDFAASAELEEAIHATAWRCDVITHLRTKMLLRRKKGAEASDELKKVVSWVVGKSLASTVPAGTS
jgi:hypothetical protein